MTPQHILRVLSQHHDNNITEFHRALNSVGGVFTGGGATGGVTLNYYEPYYSWRTYPESTFIPYNYIGRIREYLDAEPWGNVNLGGTIYRLKPDVDIDAAISALSMAA
ncbi:MAG: hypothetical protein E6995_13120 [Enterobacteriaceae bacterium]|uniref:hypothetical protein n=1 Tax=Hafnia paralvei TaxID=546367 RepID=UPI000EDD3CFF|nr:hypothetical protein [Hafnia paralvei]MDU1193076.1 hypothetical protein [Enterobacteriaceae bacterium]MDU1245166.1 hypothetical protein [Enterobacteriaceae bacterium]HCU16541.1 hypothetical protein [Hafnia paralvei]